jgi:uncharacterized protein YdaU (DUF1376 family)
MFYYQFNIGDYHSHTGYLSLMEDLAYRRLLDHYYLQESPLPKDPKNVARVIGMREYSDEVAQILEDFFFLEDGGWINKRANEEIAVYHSKADTARVNGKKGGRPKKPSTNPDLTQQEPKETQPVNLANPEEPSPTPAITGLQANQEPRTKNQEPVTSNQVKPLVDSQENTTTPAREVFECWQRIMNHKTAKLDDKRKKLINSALKTGYSVADLYQAILGCSVTPHNMGKNDRNQRYDGLHIILKPENIDRFISANRKAADPNEGFEEFFGMQSNSNDIEGELVSDG